ncbi:MAG TPA: hypothetical protein VF790_06485, partial [Dissulfurispiraceae bacterium]
MSAINLHKRDFLEAAGNGLIPPLSLELPFCEPCLVHKALCRSRRSTRNTVLLESVKGSRNTARYSFIAFDPHLVFSAKDGEVRIEDIERGKRSVSRRTPLERLHELLAAYPQRRDPGLPPFQGGAVGLLSYDFVRYFENIPRMAEDDLGIPDGHFMMADRVIAFDHLLRKAWVVVSPGARRTELGYRDLSGTDWAKEYEESEGVLQRISDELSVTSHESPSPQPPLV